MNKPQIELILAADANMGIGFEGKLPWKSKVDMKNFAEITKWAQFGYKNVVIMGRITFESIGCPLSDRINIVVTHGGITGHGIYTVNDLETALELARSLQNVNKIFIIGGATIYKQMVEKFAKEINFLRLTKFNQTFRCDKFFNEIYRLKLNPVAHEDIKDTDEISGKEMTGKIILYEVKMM